MAKFIAITIYRLGLMKFLLL